MGIESIQPNPERSGSVDRSHQKHSRPAATPQGQGSPYQQAANFKDTDPHPASTQEAIQAQQRSAEEHSHLIEKMRQLEEATREQQTQQQMELQLEDVSHELTQTRQALEDAQHQKLQESLAAVTSSGPLSHWEQRNLAEKSKVINSLRDSVQNLELNRSALVENIAEQIRSNTYHVTGAEILAGITNELL